MLPPYPLIRWWKYPNAAHNPLSYTSAPEGCACAFIAIADMGGHGVDHYLHLPEEIVALAIAQGVLWTVPIWGMDGVPPLKSLVPNLAPRKTSINIKRRDSVKWSRWQRTSRVG